MWLTKKNHELYLIPHITTLLKKIFTVFIYFETERDSMSRGGAGREGDTESESEAGSRL